MNTTTTHKIKLTAGTTLMTGVLYDNATARDFLAQLPLTLTLTDYNGTEKISDLPNRLSTSGAPAGYDPSAGTSLIMHPGEIWLCSTEISAIQPD